MQLNPKHARSTGVPSSLFAKMSADQSPLLSTVLGLNPKPKP